MKRRTAVFCAGSVIAVGLSVAAHASPQTRATDQPTPTEESRTTGDIAVTGCLQRGIDGQYVVANVDVADAGANPAAAAAGAATDPLPAGKVIKNWWLEGQSDLDEHVGQRVQVVGRDATNDPQADEASTGARATAMRGTTREATPTGTAGTPDASEKAEAPESSHSSAGRLEVKTVKALGSGCS